MPEIVALPASVLPPGVRSCFVEGVNGLRMHILEAGFETPGRPLLLLLHGFPELAFSWRKVIAPLAAAGFHVVAPDQRGYGRTTGWHGCYDDDLDPFRMQGLATDMLALVVALGRVSVAAVIGHDFGSPVAAWCGLARPDVFRAVVLMSAPFGGVPRLDAPPGPPIYRDLAALPRPRKHYVMHYGTRCADADMRNAPQGLRDFLRAYYHVKSADWPENRPFPLQPGRAEDFALMPTYYIMDRDAGMAETVAPAMPSPEQVAACAWLTEAELAVYAGEFARTGFQGGLNWYRGRLAPGAYERLFAGRGIDVPALFIAGNRDWGIHQRPGEFESMQGEGCTRFHGARLIDGAGHWVQQEQSEAVVAAVLGFIDEL